MEKQLKKNSLLDKHCLVIGATGFIGQHLTRALLSQGADVTAVGYQNHHIEEQSNYRYKQVDLINLDAFKSLSHTPYQYIFNLSGYIDHLPYFSGGRAVVNNHYLGLMNVLDVIDRSELKGFVQVGSSDEYGNQPSPQIESVREAPISPYSCAKVSASHLIQMLAKTEGFPGVVLRFFLVYGPGQGDGRFLPQIIKGCLKDQSFPTSHGEQLRDFCYVTDVVDAMLLAATTPSSHGEIINVASGLPVTIKHMIESIRQSLGKGQPQYGEFPYRQGENMSLYADISKAEKLLGWHPKVSLTEGLQITIDALSRSLLNYQGVV